MSIASQITRIQGLVAELRTNIQAKGVTLANDADLETCVDAVPSISGGSGSTDIGDDYLCFENTGSSTVTISAYNIEINDSNPTSPLSNTNYYAKVDGYEIQYSTDKTTWTTVDAAPTAYNSAKSLFNISAGGKVYVRSDKNRFINKIYSNVNYLNMVAFYNNTSGASIKISGDLRSMVGNGQIQYSRDYQFACMFYGQGFTNATDLKIPACMSDGCFYSLFYSTKIGGTAPSLPSTKTTKNCYRRMFYGSSITTAPSLPATTLAVSCYQDMFNNCTSLTAAPSLPATTLDDDCYNAMFYNCSGITSLPTLAATTMKVRCYQSMFTGCAGLTSIPINYLPATTLANECYVEMFYSCANIIGTPCSLPATTLTSSCYSGMFRNCTKLTSVASLSATSLQANCYKNMYYGCTGITSIPSGYLNVTTLYNYCYYGMFRGCTGLTSSGIPSNLLPATTVGSESYREMFMGCTGLTTAPTLPATTLNSSCYRDMFSGCTGLTTAPTLSATTLANACYQNMFSGCTSLTTTPDLNATTLVANCYYGMFYNCTGLTSAMTTLPATTLQASCYYQMFYGCDHLETAPILPATTLVSNCYYQMFNTCRRLTYLKAMFTTTPSNTYTNAWLQNTYIESTSEGITRIFVKNSAATWTTTGVNAVPAWWTIQTEAA